MADVKEAFGFEVDVPDKVKFLLPHLELQLLARPMKRVHHNRHENTHEEEQKRDQWEEEERTRENILNIRLQEFLERAVAYEDKMYCNTGWSKL